MKKIRFISSIILSLFLLTGCAYNNDLSNENINANVNNEDTNEVNVQKEKTEIDINSLKPAEKELLSILNNIEEKVEIGTAGSTLKAVSYTSNLMNWAIGTELYGKEIDNVVSLKLNSLSDKGKESLKNQMNLINNTYKDLLSDNRDEILNLSGNTNLSEHAWIDVLNEDVKTLENFDTLINAFDIK